MIKEFFELVAMEGRHEYEAGGGGGKGAAPQALPQVAPTAPVEEASVEIDDGADKKKLKTTKESLKIPMTETVNAGLKV